MEEKDFRNKITWFTFFFSLLVIWVHSYNAVLFLGNNKVAYKTDWLERFLGEDVAQIAVPGFFLISSYLFFRNFTMARLREKWKSRIKSILIPYIVWNLLYYLGYVIGSRIPVITEVIGKGTVPFHLPAAADAVIHYTYNYVFWYLNQLIFLILLAPLIYFIIKQKAAGVICLILLFTAIYFGASLPAINLDALLYYSAGAYGAVHGRQAVEGLWTWKSFFSGVLLLAASLILYQMDFPGNMKGEAAASVVCLRLIMPIGLWFLIPEHILGEVRGFMNHNFFLYAIHFSLVRLINKTGAMLLPPIPVIPFLLFLLMPAVCVGLSYVMGGVLRRTLPPLWSLLNGGR